jgi:3',5'-cyclic AMP phosphodiesterase CpdA
MRIVQITDSHILEPGRLWKDRVDTAAALRAAVARVNAHAPDLVVHTGDVTEHGTAEQSAHAADILGGLDAPLRVLPGNHDDRDALRAAFPGHVWEGPGLNFATDAEGLRVVGLDTVDPGETSGRLDAARLAWLAEALAAEKPTLVFAHHPPCALGLPMMDAWPFAGGEALTALLGGRRDVLRIACGHVHAQVDAHAAGTLVSACPALSVAIPVDQRLDGRAGYMLDPGAIRLHDWNAATGRLAVKLVSLAAFEGPVHWDGLPVRD